MDQLSDEAIEVLRLAAGGEDGAIILLDFLDGEALQINGKNLLEGKDRPTAARYRSAVRSLAASQLIEDRAGTGEVFFMTGAGYDISELGKSD